MIDDEIGAYKVYPTDPVIVYKNGGFGFNFKNKKAVQNLISNFKKVAELDIENPVRKISLNDIIDIMDFNSKIRIQIIGPEIKDLGVFIVGSIKKSLNGYLNYNVAWLGFEETLKIILQEA